MGQRALRRLRRGCDVALCSLVIVVVGLGAFSALAPLAHRQVVIIRGSSMQPTIALGSLILVDSGRRSPTPGDVVTVREGNEVFVTHRVVAVTGGPAGSVQLKGDANPSPDPTPVPVSSMIGTVEFAVPFLGYVLAFITLPTGMLTIILVGLSLLVAAWLIEDLEVEGESLSGRGSRTSIGDPGPEPESDALTTCDA